jgi:tetratricopeptide (TPR) repeat protein
VLGLLAAPAGMAWRAGAMAGTAAVAGCAPWMPPQALALHERPPADLPRRAELDAVPFFPQTPYHCGPAALATVLNHVGRSVRPEALADETFLPAREGTLQTEMLAAARRHGTWAQRLPRELEAVLREVAAGHAVVVLLNLGLSMLPRWHYAVVVGYDLGEATLVLRSGTVRRDPWPMRTFEHTWARGGHWAFLALPPQHLGVTVTQADALSAALGFERVAAPGEAARAYATQLRRWPDDAVAQMGQGNALHAAQDWQGAALAFERAAALGAGLPAWNNLALARWRNGQQALAQEAAQRAVALAEDAQGLDAATAAAWRATARATLERVRRPAAGAQGH